jgi:hypothetical protein
MLLIMNFDLPFLNNWKNRHDLFVNLWSIQNLTLNKYVHWNEINNQKYHGFIYHFWWMFIQKPDIIYQEYLSFFLNFLLLSMFKGVCRIPYATLIWHIRSELYWKLRAHEKKWKYLFLDLSLILRLSTSKLFLILTLVVIQSMRPNWNTTNFHLRLIWNTPKGLFELVRTRIRHIFFQKTNFCKKVPDWAQPSNLWCSS